MRYSTREESRKNTTGESLTWDVVNAGSLQRIADACEKMSQNIRSLEADRDMYRSWYQDKDKALNRERRRTAALRGVIRKLKEDSK